MCKGGGGGGGEYNKLNGCGVSYETTTTKVLHVTAAVWIGCDGMF